MAAQTSLDRWRGLQCHVLAAPVVPSEVQTKHRVMVAGLPAETIGQPSAVGEFFKGWRRKGGVRVKARLMIFAIGTGSLLIGAILLRAICNRQGITMWAEATAGILVAATSLPLAISSHVRKFDRREIVAWIAIGGAFGWLLYPVGGAYRIRPNDPNLHENVRASNDRVLPYPAGGVELGIVTAAVAAKLRKPKNPDQKAY